MYKFSTPQDETVAYTPSRYEAEVLAGIFEGNGYKAEITKINTH